MEPRNPPNNTELYRSGAPSNSWKYRICDDKCTYNPLLSSWRYRSRIVGNNGRIIVNASKSNSNDTNMMYTLLCVLWLALSCLCDLFVPLLVMVALEVPLVAATGALIRWTFVWIIVCGSSRFSYKSDTVRNIQIKIKNRLLFVCRNFDFVTSLTHFIPYFHTLAEEMNEAAVFSNFQIELTNVTNHLQVIVPLSIYWKANRLQTRTL